MKRIIITILLALSLAGCEIIKKPQTQVQTQTTAQITNTTHRLETIGALAIGVEATIPKQPDVAIDLNKKVMVLAEEPTPAQVKQVMDSITNTEAKEELEKKVGKLIEEKRQVAEANNKLINTLANQNASLVDAKKQAEEELADLRNPFTAIFYGVSTLVKRLLYFILGGTLLFFILRAFAASSPVVAAIFSVFEHIVAFIIKGVRACFPRSLEFAGSEDVKYYNTLEKLVGAIHKHSTPAILNELSKALDHADKEVVKEIKAELKL